MVEPYRIERQSTNAWNVWKVFFQRTQPMILGCKQEVFSDPFGIYIARCKDANTEVKSLGMLPKRLGE